LPRWPFAGGHGVATAFLPTAGPASNPTNALPAGVAFDPATGQFTVSNRTLLRNGTYNLRITTTDLFGGVNTQDISLIIGNFPLPVELADFKVQAVKNAAAQLTWRTALEKNNERFDVERSLSGSAFVKIGEVKGQGNTSASTNYALTDAGIGAKAHGLVYYRLKQIDTDGKESFSPVRTVIFSGLVPTISLAPNPATADTQLDLTQLPAGSYQVNVLDAAGRVVLRATRDAGLAQSLDLHTLASGAYLVLVRGQNGGQAVNFTKRLIKE